MVARISAPFSSKIIMIQSTQVDKHNHTQPLSSWIFEVSYMKEFTLATQAHTTTMIIQFLTDLPHLVEARIGIMLHSFLLQVIPCPCCNNALLSHSSRFYNSSSASIKDFQSIMCYTSSPHISQSHR